MGGGERLSEKMEFILCNLPEIKQKLSTRAFSEGVEHSMRRPVTASETLSTLAV